MFAQQNKQFEQLSTKQEEKVQRDQQYKDNEKRLNSIQSKKPAELFCDYDFDQQVRFFTDFMQSQMSQKMNQLYVPSQNI